MKLVRPFYVLLSISFMMATLQLHVSEASILKKLRKKLKTPVTCWREKIESHCTTTYEKSCSKIMVQQCETAHFKKCTVDYKTECVTEKEKCVMESKKLCETENTQECWEEEQKDCRTKPKCNTVLEEVCSTTYEDVCYKKKKQKRETGEDRDEMIIIDPELAVAVVERQEITTEDILQLSDKSSKVGGKLIEAGQTFTREEVALRDVQYSLANEESRNDFPILRKRNKNRNMRKKRASDLVKRIIDNRQKFNLKSRSDDKKDFSSERSKRSPGFVDYVKAVLAGYEEDCDEAARDHCVKVPVEKCHDEQSCEIQTHVKCEEVPFERCWEEPQQRCWEEPKERCWQEPYDKCWQEPQENCWEEPIDECFEVPREKCEDVTIQVESDQCETESEENNLIKPRKKRQTWDEGKVDANMFEILSATSESENRN